MQNNRTLIPLHRDHIDLFIVRNALLNAIKDVKPLLHGSLLDIGSGDMPYKSILESGSSIITQYVGVDLANSGFSKPSTYWNGNDLPFESNSFDCAILTEVLEHCFEPERILEETNRVLKSNGIVFLTVPFIWPLHHIPNDHYRYTPFALNRLLTMSNFDEVQLKPLGGWDASLGQMIALWATHRPMTRRRRRFVGYLAALVVRVMSNYDRLPENMGEKTMFTGIAATARKRRKRN